MEAVILINSQSYLDGWGWGGGKVTYFSSLEYLVQIVQLLSFYDIIKKVRESFTEEQRDKKRNAEINLRRKAVEIANSENTFYNKILKGVLKNISCKNFEVYGEA